MRGACEMKRQPDECHKIHLRANRATFGYGKHFRLAYGSNRREIEEKKKHIKLQQHIENLSVSLLLSHSFSFSDSHPISSCPPLYLPSQLKTKTHSSSFFADSPSLCVCLIIKGYYGTHLNWSDG